MASTLNASATAWATAGRSPCGPTRPPISSGRITATGGASGGNGGSVEVSANPATHGVLTYSGFADLTAREGHDGTSAVDSGALTLLEKASDSGSAPAAYDLAALISLGVGGRPPGEALALFRRAAAVLLDESRGVAKDLSAAA